MNLRNKLIFLLGLFFVIRFVQACITCPENTIPFDFTRVNIRNLDHSGSYLSWNETDTMYSAAVAFMVEADGRESLYSATYPKYQFSMFKAAIADDCDPLFEARNDIKKVSIISLYSMNDEITSGTDVSELFYGSIDGFLYSGINETLSSVYRRILSGEPVFAFNIFCGTNIENEYAQFLINIELENGDIVSGHSALITLLPSETK